jgi:hypothetical protein
VLCKPFAACDVAVCIDLDLHGFSSVLCRLGVG